MRAKVIGRGLLRSLGGFVGCVCRLRREPAELGQALLTGERGIEQQGGGIAAGAASAGSRSIEAADYARGQRKRDSVLICHDGMMMYESLIMNRLNSNLSTSETKLQPTPRVYFAEAITASCSVSVAANATEPAQ